MLCMSLPNNDSMGVGGNGADQEVEYRQGKQGYVIQSCYIIYNLTIMCWNETLSCVDFTDVLNLWMF